MVSIFTTTKEFKGIYKTIQINALRSWRSISDEVEIIIFGSEKGSKEAAKEIGGKYISDVKCSKLGTPLLSDLFHQADLNAKFSILVYINADIILPPNFLDEIKCVSKFFNKYLMIGHRWDMDVDNEIRFDNNKQANYFWKKVNSKSIKHSCTGIDYFVFKKNQWQRLPEFIIGRPGFDNWLIWKARRRLLPVIDCSSELNVVHQNHNINKHYNIEGDQNKKLHQGKTLNILDSTYILLNGRILKKNNYQFKIRNLHRLPNIFPEFSIFIKLYRRLFKIYINIFYFNKK